MHKEPKSCSLPITESIVNPSRLKIFYSEDFMTHKMTKIRIAKSAAAMAILLSTMIVGSTHLSANEPIGTSAIEDAEAALKAQGEYLGGPIDDEDVTIGIQVIALGDDKYRFVGFMGGLPGDDEVQRMDQEADGTRDGDVIKFSTEHGKGELKDGVISILGPEGNEVATFEKVVRKSPTMGAKPPEGAIVLFDGSSADHFENGKLDKGFLASTGCYSKEKFGDHKLHIEFRTPFMPEARGQGRGNSGVYVQSRYEVQVLDSFGLSGESNECGGIYRVSKPKVNMCYPPMTWQTYDIDFTAAEYDEDGKKTKPARITVKHNGVVIHDDLELPNSTPGRFGEEPGKEALFLQDHGNPVHFRNIWVVEEDK